MPQREQLVVEIDGNNVTIKIRCIEAYAAIQLYEELCAGAREGFVVLDVATRISADVPRKS